MISETASVLSPPLLIKRKPLRCSSAKRNPFCRKYEQCLNTAARLNVKRMDCCRCFFRNDQSAREETAYYLSGYLRLLKVVIHGDKGLDPTRSRVADIAPLDEGPMGFQQTYPEKLEWWG